MRKSILIKNLSKSFGKNKALDNISFDILKGRITGFLGPNGAGKSTIIKCLLGLIKKDKDSGTLVLDGEKIDNFQDLRFIIKIGAVVEFHSFYLNLTAFENLKILFQYSNIDIDYRKIDRLLSLVNLKQSRNIKVKAFSFGMKQKLAIASSLINDPDLLILDEPFNGLDPNAMDDLSKFLKNYSDSGGTVLISSHILGELEGFCDDIIIINKGKIKYKGELKKADSQKSLKDIYLEVTQDEMD